MVTLYVAGQKVGTLADAEKLIPEFIARNIPIELRGDGGGLLGKLTTVQPPTPAEPLVPLDPSITREDLDRIAAEPGLTFDEVKKRLGWE